MTSAISYHISMLKLLLSLTGAAALTFAAQVDQVAYGKYLVEEVAKCAVCHTPRQESGEFDKSKWLQGATLDFQPSQEVKDWHKTSPDITPGGKLWQRWGEQGIVKFLEAGLGPRGNAADPPMPAYRLRLSDAEAIVAYLKSLKPQ